MNQTKIVIIAGLLLVVVIAGLTYKAVTDNGNREAGLAKFKQALAQVIEEQPSINNPCIGKSVTRNYSFEELNRKSLDEVKTLVLKDPGSC